MSYVKQNFVDGQTLTAAQLNHMEQALPMLPERRAKKATRAIKETPARRVQKVTRARALPPTQRRCC